MTSEKFELRDYQKDAVRAVLQKLANGKRSICLVSPTGGGKTMMGCALAAKVAGTEKKCLWVACSRDLVTQTVERLSAQMGRENVQTRDSFGIEGRLESYRKGIWRPSTFRQCRDNQTVP